MKRLARWMGICVLVTGCGVAVDPAPQGDRQVQGIKGFNGNHPFPWRRLPPPPLPQAPCPCPPEAPGETPPMAPPEPAPTPGPACGTYVTFTQGGWGSRPHGQNPGQYLATNWSQLAPEGTLTVGVGHTLTFGSAEAVGAFLPSGGPPAALTGSHQDPAAPTEAGVLAGQVTALKLNVLASALRQPEGTAPLADLKFTSGAFAGDTVGELLTRAEQALGGDASALAEGQTLSDLSDAAAQVNEFSAEGRSPEGTFLACP